MKLAIVGAWELNLYSIVSSSFAQFPIFVWKVSPENIYLHWRFVLSVRNREIIKQIYMCFYDCFHRISLHISPDALKKFQVTVVVNKCVAIINRNGRKAHTVLCIKLWETMQVFSYSLGIGEIPIKFLFGHFCSLHTTWATCCKHK